MAKQTAVDWYYEQTVVQGKTNYYELLEQAKQMEKEQIEKAFSDGQETPINHPTIPHYSREEYFNDNYNK